MKATQLTTTEDTLKADASNKRHLDHERDLRAARARQRIPGGQKVRIIKATI